MPVFFACRGCERDGPAREVAQGLDRLGVGEAYAAGQEVDRARARFPIYAIEGCEKRCAERWLAGLGVTPSKSFMLGEKTIAEELKRIARLAS